MPDTTKSAKKATESSGAEPAKVEPHTFANWKQRQPQTSEQDHIKLSLESKLAALEDKAKRLKTLPREQQAELLPRTESAIANIKETLKQYA